MFVIDQDLSKNLEALELVPIMIKTNEIIAHYLIEEGLLQLYFQKFAEIQKAASNDKDKDSVANSNKIAMFHAIEMMLRSCITDSMYKKRSLAPTYLFNNQLEWNQYPVVPKEMMKTMQEYEPFNKGLLPMQAKTEGLLKVLEHLSWEDKEFSNSVIYYLMTHICRYKDFYEISLTDFSYRYVVEIKEINENMKLVYNLCLTPDSLQSYRIDVRLYF